MTRNEFVRSTGRWLMLSVILAMAGLLLASQRVSIGNYCGTRSNCAGCGLRKVCSPADKNKIIPHEQEEKL